jgi:MoxR-like ATPase
MSPTSGESGRMQDGRAQPANEAARTVEEPGDKSDKLKSTPNRGEQGKQIPKWYVFKGRRADGAGKEETPGLDETASSALSLPPPPPWRDFGRRRVYKGETFRASPEEVRVVNAAIYLRRPLLITGLPGTGKSSLAYAIAAELGLGEVLVWAITSRSQLKDGLYGYDAIGRLQASNLSRPFGDEGPLPPPIGDYLRLGPLGTALADSRPNRPRVLLIDEIDKSDIDLPNDLLNSFEEGEFEIPELARLAPFSQDEGQTDPSPADPTAQRVLVRLHRPRGIQSPRRIEIVGGRVRCAEFPIVLLTSNGERALPAPFLRRCLRLEIRPPDEEKLQNIVRAHFARLNAEEQLPDEVIKLIKKVVDRRNNPNKREYVATDQLMNAIHLVLSGIELTSSSETAGEGQDPRAGKQLVDFILEAIGTSLV